MALGAFGILEKYGIFSVFWPFLVFLGVIFTQPRCFRVFLALHMTSTHPRHLPDTLRDHPDTATIINQLYSAAKTLGDPKPHKDAIASAKLIVERLVPSLKASEIKVDTDNDTPFIMMPQQEEPDKDE